MFFETTTRGIVLRVRLCPNSSCCKLSGLFTAPDGSVFLKISVISIPEKGKANLELIKWLAKKLKTAKSNLTIISGELDRSKKILITAENETILPQLRSWVEKEQLNDSANH